MPDYDRKNLRKMQKSPTFEVISGTYEEFLLGYYFSSKEGTLAQSFAAHDHTGSVRCVTVSDPYLASGGTDDRIFIYDLKSRKEVCSLTHHNATINCLQFTENHSHIMSGSADGVLTIVRVGNWQVEKIWEKAHKGCAVLDIAIHSSGKLALTLGANASLCTWNLVKGRLAYIINLNSKSKDARSLEKILWAADGVRFVLFGGKYVELWTTEDGGVLAQYEHEEKVSSCCWLSDSTLLVGHESGEVTVLDTDDGSKKINTAHSSRVKSITTYKKWVITVSSNGEIKVWNKDMEEIAVFDTGCRLTCLCVVPPIKIKLEKAVEEIVEVNKQVAGKEIVARVIEIDESEQDVEEIGHKRRKNAKTGGKKKIKSKG